MKVDLAGSVAWDGTLNFQNGRASMNFAFTDCSTVSSLEWMKWRPWKWSLLWSPNIVVSLDRTECWWVCEWAGYPSAPYVCEIVEEPWRWPRISPQDLKLSCRFPSDGSEVEESVHGRFRISRGSVPAEGYMLKLIEIVWLNCRAAFDNDDHK